MKLERARYDPGELLEFYEHGLTALGALCERTWHDRLAVVAEGHAAEVLAGGHSNALHEVELHFAPGDAIAARDAAREVFPGCPLTFQLAETLCRSPLPLERFVMAETVPPPPPAVGVAEKLWRTQFSDTTHWQLIAPFTSHLHFGLMAFARCEIQAIDQHWSLHRVAISLPNGELDDNLAQDLGFHQTSAETIGEIAWPTPDPAQWSMLLKRALEQELTGDLARVRARQENSLRREWERLDDYFENYERELMARSRRSSSESAKLKVADRLAAANAEHARRRADQLARHEIRVKPHVDGLLLVAENVWRATLRVEHSHRPQTLNAVFLPRSRRWVIEDRQI
jgi:hypothetical protein